MLTCPHCGSTNFRTIDTRNLEKYTGWFRRKECRECHQRWNTFEVYEDMLKESKPDDPIRSDIIERYKKTNLEEKNNGTYCAIRY